MSDYIFFLLLGTGSGAIIAAFGLALVVTHQGSGVVNFAIGAMAAWSGYVYADLRRGAYPFPFPGLPARAVFGDDVGLWPAMALSMLTAVVLAVIVFVLVFRPLGGAPDLARVVASVGLLIALTSLVERRFSDNAGLRVDPILPNAPVSFTSAIVVPRDGLWLALIVGALASVAWFGSRRTQLGLATRAAASNETGAVLLGYSPNTLAATSFVFASVIASVAVILASPMLQLSSGVFAFGFLIPALGAALVGRFRNVWVTVGVGLVIGMLQSAITKLQIDIAWFPQYGAREGLPFLVIIAVMAARGERLATRGSLSRWRLPDVPPASIRPLSVLFPTGVAVVGVLALGPLWRAAIMTSAIATVTALSLVVLTGFAGQTSLAQMSFAGVAGFTLSKLTTGWGVPFPIAPILAASTAMVFGVLIGLPALRVRGTNLAIVTLAGGIAIAEFGFKNPRVVGDASTGGAKIPNPRVGPWDLGLTTADEASRPVFGIVLVLVAVVVAIAVANLRRSPSGRRMLATRSNERAASAAGIAVTRVKLQAYAVSSFLAGLAGCLIGYRFGGVSDASFGAVASLAALSVAYLGGVTSISGAVTSGVLAASGVAFFAMSRLTDRLGVWETFIGGVLLIVTAVLNPEGIAGGVRRQAANRRVRLGRVA